jgi:WD40 repeat protein
VAISPDSQWLATSDDKRVWIWDARTGRERARMEHYGPVYAVAISPDGQWLATASDDGTTRIWDSRTGRERARLQHYGPVRAVAISPDGQWLATASDDGTARIWDARKGREYLRLEFEDTITSVAFMRDGQLLAVAHGHLVALEAWRAEDLVHDLCARVTRNLTPAEWGQYLGQEQYHRTCPNLLDPVTPKRTTR